MAVLSFIVGWRLKITTQRLLCGLDMKGAKVLNIILQGVVLIRTALTACKKPWRLGPLTVDLPS